MKKAVIGIMAMTGLLIAGQQALATSFVESVENIGYGAFSLKYTGYTETTNALTENSATDGLFSITGLYDVISGLQGDVPSVWDPRPANGYAYVVFEGIHGDTILSQSVEGQETTIQLGDKGGTFSLYQTTTAVTISSGPSAFNQFIGLTAVLSGVFVEIDGYTLRQTITTDQYGQISDGTGTAYASVTGGILKDYFNNDLFLGGSDMKLTFNIGPDSSNNWSTNGRTGALITDPSDTFNPVPEPATMLLFGTGLAGLAGIRRKRNK